MRKIIEKLNNIFEQINLFVPESIIIDIITDDRNYFYNIFKHTMNMYGGGNNETIKFIYNGIDFYFDKYNDKYSIHYSIYRHDDIKQQENTCIYIMVNKQEKNAYIGEISYDQKCFNTSQEKQMKKFQKGNNEEEYEFTGSLLLKVGLKFIDTIKDHYDLQFIQLKDNSRKLCGKINEYIDIDSLSMLTNGDTWYGKYGFVPYDKDKKQTDIFNYKKYKYNQNIVNTKILKDTNIIETIEYIMTKLEMNKKIINEIQKSAEKYMNMPIKHFLNWFLKKKREKVSCYIFFLAYKQIMYDLQMHNLHNIVYWKKL